ncbi:MAG: hypothetical protein RLZZ258_780 [Actinomycetota bacterium]
MKFLRNSYRQAPLTTALVLLNVVLWLLQLVPDLYLTDRLVFTTLHMGSSEPWRAITAGFIHDPNGPFHLLINMYSVYIFGQVLEPMLGKVRFAALYLISIFGGSVAVMFLAPAMTFVYGASSAVFGLMAAYLVVLRSLGGSSQGMVGLIALNLVIGFILPGISWQAHVGGLLAGGAVASVYANTRGPKQQTAQKISVVLIVTIFIALAIYRLQQITSGSMLSF